MNNWRLTTSREGSSRLWWWLTVYYPPISQGAIIAAEAGRDHDRALIGEEAQKRQDLEEVLAEVWGDLVAIFGAIHKRTLAYCAASTNDVVTKGKTLRRSAQSTIFYVYHCLSSSDAVSNSESDNFESSRCQQSFLHVARRILKPPWHPIVNLASSYLDFATFDVLLIVVRVVFCAVVPIPFGDAVVLGVIVIIILVIFVAILASLLSSMTPPLSIWLIKTSLFPICLDSWYCSNP